MDRRPVLLRAAEALERASVLDVAVAAVSRAAQPVVAHDRVRAVLRGAPLGHPAHPMLTDLPIGLWVSSIVLDLVGPRSSVHGPLGIVLSVAGLSIAGVGAYLGGHLASVLHAPAPLHPPTSVR